MTTSDPAPSVRAAYDTWAVRYAELFSTDLQRRPLDRALLAVFAELVLADGGAPVADLGCGPGHVTAHLRSLGLDAFGIDLSPRMVALAREAYPGLRFEEESMAALSVADGALGGILARYSIIHTPPDRLPAVFAEFHRILAPGGHLLLAFQADEDPAQLGYPFDHKVALAYRWSPARVSELLGEHGLVVDARLMREPDEDERAFPQAQLLAVKPPAGG